VVSRASDIATSKPDKNWSRRSNLKCWQEPNIEQFKYLGTTLTNQNSIHEEIKEQIEIRECLLSFCAESLFQFTIQKCKD
jgi:hypothetical protein